MPPDCVGSVWGPIRPQINGLRVPSFDNRHEARALRHKVGRAFFAGQDASDLERGPIRLGASRVIRLSEPLAVVENGGLIVFNCTIVAHEALSRFRAWKLAHVSCLFDVTYLNMLFFIYLNGAKLIFDPGGQDRSIDGVLPLNLTT
jgi:hypothetical protein